MRDPQLLDLSCEHEVILYWNPQWGFMEDWVGESDQGGNLTQLPKSLREISSLRELYLHGNDGLGLPSAVIGPSWNKVANKLEKPASPAEILEYYFRLQQGDQHTLNEAKLILVGHGGVGKTSIFNRLLYDTFDRDKKKTEGIQIAEWKLRLKGKEAVRLNVWDFGGREFMHATHQFFLTQPHNLLAGPQRPGGARKSDAEYWLRLIESLGAESPVLLVLNKIKENPFDLNRRGLRQKYSSIRGFIPTDCEDRTGIAELRAAIRTGDGLLGTSPRPFPGQLVCHQGPASRDEGELPDL